MAENTDIFDGTVSVAAGTKAVTGVDTLWLSAGIQAGDMFGSDGHPRARIDTVNSNTSITLKDNWRGPTLPAGSPYWIRYQADSSRYAALLGQVRKMLSQATLAAFSALTGAANKIPYFIDANTMGLADFGANARDTLANAKAWTTSLFGLTMAADRFPYGTGPNTIGLADLTAAGRALLDDADASAQLTTLGVSAYIKTLLDDPNTAAAFATLGGSSGTTASGGWYKLPGGLIIQWASQVGVVQFGGGGINVAIPTAFSSASSWTFAAWSGESTSGSITLSNYGAGQAAGSFTVVVRNSVTGGVAGDGGAYRINYVAVGK